MDWLDQANERRMGRADKGVDAHFGGLRETHQRR
jgi:hypothetical protein